MRRLRVLTASPKPLSKDCENPTVSVDWTAGLKKLAVEVELLRVLFQLTLKSVPVPKYCENWLVNWLEWDFRAAGVVLPVPEMNGLLTGVERSSTDTPLLN